MKVAFKISDEDEVLLSPVKISEYGEGNLYQLIDEEAASWMDLELKDNKFKVLEKDEKIQESAEKLNQKLDDLVLAVIQEEQSGTELNETDATEEIQPFDPEKIKVHAKQFSLRLIADMIDDGDIDLNPDFQRNLVWSNFQKSRLIESILLRIPLPMFYFSEDDEGRITIVDGLQRLTTIKEFMDNKFPLKKLEYLTDSCENRYYKDEGNKEGLDSKYARWFKQTQFSVNVIDPSSPAKVKYDIFRRINTGGKPLNNQEIRNCLAGKGLRNTIREMAKLEEFITATDKSIKSARMEDQEVALRFIMFYRLKEQDGDFSGYSGYMDTALDNLTEELYKSTEEDLKKYIDLYSNAMKNAEYLFGGRYAFRKVRLKDIKPNAYKQLLNKALFVCWSVLLADFDHAQVRKNIKEQALLEPLATAIENDIELFKYLSYGTNGRNNLLYVYDVVNRLIETNL